MTGALAAHSLLKTAPADGYLAVSKASQVPFVAARVVEPLKGSPVVSMLDALPETESAFYAVEDNLLLRGGYSETLKREIEDHYSFLGGKPSEWIEYLCREDYDRDMWSFLLPKDVAAYAGVSAVPKKNGVDLRKLIMACAANYMWVDVTKRFDHGMGGAAAIGHLVTWTAGLSVTVIDQSNAFTAVRTPGWMHRYFGCPPVPAEAVWHLLDEPLRRQITPKDMVVPCYTRLPMGSSHSVHILMTMNMERAGRVLTSRWRPRTETVTEVPELMDEQACLEEDPTETLRGQSLSRVASSGPSVGKAAPAGHLPHRSNGQAQHAADQNDRTSSRTTGPRAFIELAARAKAAVVQVFVVLHCFAGQPRAGDVEDWLHRMGEQLGILFLIQSVDVVSQPEWDLR